MSLTLRSAVASDPGLIRDNNEDAAHAGHRLLAVADGIGGAPSGEVASSIVMRLLIPLESARPQTDPLSAALEALRAVLEAGNREISAAVQADNAHEGMGTTVTAMLLAGDQLALVHVGDSRAYLMRDGALSQLTKDDTYVQSLVDRGVITAAQARHHPQKSIITQAIQGGEFALTAMTVSPGVGDRMMLCSDGLSDIVTDESIAEVLLSGAEPLPCAQRLVKLAHAAGAPDNVTVIVADVVAV